jgi:hypothetical protein
MSKKHKGEVVDNKLGDDYLLIEEYFANGFNGMRAVQKIRSYWADNTASAYFTKIKKSEHGKAYINKLRNQIRESIVLDQENVLQNLIDWIQADATDYLDMTPTELKALPSSVRRSIASIVHKKKKYTHKGEDVVEEYVTIKLMDKMKALDMLNKMAGHYEIHNRQKNKTIDISSATPEQLNAVLSLMTGQIEDNKEKTIDL